MKPKQAHMDSYVGCSSEAFEHQDQPWGDRYKNEVKLGDRPQGHEPANWEGFTAQHTLERLAERWGQTAMTEMVEYVPVDETENEYEFVGAAA